LEKKHQKTRKKSVSLQRFFLDGIKNIVLMKSIDIKKAEVDQFAVTRNPSDFDAETGNIYKTVAMLSKRANQISNDLKDEYIERIQDFRSAMNSDSDEVVENSEIVDLSRYYEQLPKPTLVAIHEFESNQIYYKDVEKVETKNVKKK
jgi:DNA-directed RNA polymerase subunit K/omega